MEKAEDGIRDVERSRGLGDVYKRQGVEIVQTPSLDQSRPLAEVTFTDVVIEPENIMIELDEELSIWNKVQNISTAFLAMEPVSYTHLTLPTILRV